MTGRRLGRAALFAFFWIVAVGYLLARFDRGWIPHDEGLLGQSAERVLAGELPHRDFDDPYTGGLSFLHAAAFRLFGLRLASLRLTLLFFAVAFVGALLALAGRSARPWVAGLAVWTAVAWSLPLYFAALPSWYNLFFATFGTLALVRFLESDRRRWLFAAGLCAGASILIKVVGLYFVAAGLLFLLHREQRRTAELREPGPAPGFRVATATGLLLFAGVVVALVARTPDPMTLLHFAVPPLAVAGFLLHREHRLPWGSSGRRWRRLAALLAPFVAGAALPPALFAGWYAAHGALWELFRGVFLLPQKRFHFAATELPPWPTLLAAVPVALLLAVPLRRRLPDRWLLPAVAAVAGGVLLAFGEADAVHRGVWASVRPLVPVAVAVGCFLLAGADRFRTLEEPRRQRLFLFLAVAAMTSLVQIPDAFAVYFGYVAPLLVLALLELVASLGAPPRRTLAVVTVFYLAFATLHLHGSLVLAQGERHFEVTLDTPLELPRGGLRMPAQMAEVYEELVRVIQAHSPPGSYVYATPDAPEVYFLAARRNPTRTFFDFFEPDHGRPLERTARLLETLESHGVDLVVIHHAPRFSGPVPPLLATVLERRYPNRADVGPYSVLWREPSRREPSHREPSHREPPPLESGPHESDDAPPTKRLER